MEDLVKIFTVEGSDGGVDLIVYDEVISEGYTITSDRADYDWTINDIIALYDAVLIGDIDSDGIPAGWNGFSRIDADLSDLHETRVIIAEYTGSNLILNITEMQAAGASVFGIDRDIL